MTIPIVPSVAMKAKASGMPPKLAATPENVPYAERTQFGRSLADRGIRDQEPEEPTEEGRREADPDALPERVADVRRLDDRR